MSKKDDFKDLSEVNAKTLGNFTRDAVKQFENNIVSQTDYLEKVEEKAVEDKS
ncbi:hypothetical protein [Candidatus Clostridium stratigraminis]|uniref:Uncharacterized protein n=1 Tax=Candidatus Clostridium stratigraminis TaxID=3381661 RepID=A0ABW8T6V3_9CLOT